MSTKRQTIMLVDDNITNLTVGNNILKQDYNIMTLNSAQRLFQVLEIIVPDLILLDIEMPEMNGFEAIKILKEKNELKDIPVIFLTAKIDVDSELEGLTLGAIDYIGKPFSPPLLLKRLELHLLLLSQKKALSNQQRELMAFNENLQQMVDEKTKTVVELKNAILSTMAELVDRRDSNTGGHIERTQQYLSILLDALWINDEFSNEASDWDKDLLLQSAQLHDIGKIAIDDKILRKPGKLTPDEYDTIKKHTKIGATIIEGIEKKSSQQDFLVQAKMLAATHHERWDGSGYHSGLSGKEIPLQGRLMAIADVYDALVSDRPYRAAMTHEEAVEIIINGKGTHFDPALIEIFLGVSDDYKKLSTQFRTQYEHKGE